MTKINTGGQMTPQDAALLASLTGFTPGPWTAWNMIHADTGLPMTPDELGEMVKNNVLQSIKNGGSAERFMFVSGETPIGPADMCHVGNGPNGLRNTALIAAAPDLHRIATEQAAEIERLWEALGLIRDHDRVYGVTPQSNGAQVWHDGECGTIAGAALAVQP